MRIRPRYSRREFLKLSGAAAAVALLEVSDLLTPQHSIAATLHRWSLQANVPAGGTVTTPTLQPEGRFNAVDLSWQQVDPAAVVQAFVRISADGYSWSDWLPMHIDAHGPGGVETRIFCAPLLCDAVAVEARIEAAADSGVGDLVVGVLDTSTKPSNRLKALAADDLIDGFIIPRAGWGADEALRHADQDLTKPIIWNPSYQPIEKIIVHHTATTNDPSDPEAAIRAVYYFHAVTRGWGDIGYNFLVDWQGRVYEGRYGGVNVIGGHALQYNYGSLGIALLGNFDEDSPPDDMLDALVQLVQVRAGDIDVTAAADFVDLADCPNLCGHGDVLSTSCPGGYAHELLPQVRGMIAGTAPVYLDPPVLTEAVQVLSCDIGPTTVYSGNILEVRMTLYNAGSSPLISSSPEPGYIYDEGDEFADLGFAKVSDTYRFGLDFKGNDGTINPYRWGFGTPLLPGEEREVVGYVRVNRRSTTTWSASVVKEFVRYIVDHDFPQRISVSDPPIGPTAASTDAGVRYFSETGHNVPRSFARYWEANGGLPRFGYPLTEAFEEVSETDGVRYLTQYFERARFEFHPEYAGTKDEVLLGLLGTELSRGRSTESAFRPVAAPDDDALWFSETEHTLSGRFLTVWEENGGLPIFGYPISEEFEERSQTDGVRRTVQYFERNRFEYHPDYAGTKDEVMLGHLAREVLIRRGWLEPSEA